MSAIIKCANCGLVTTKGPAKCPQCQAPLVAAPEPPPPITVAFPNERMAVTVTDVDIPFISLVGLLLKLGLAAVPAAIILGFLFVALTVLIGGGVR